MVDYKRFKFDRMEKGEHHKPMQSGKFVRNEELNEHHFMHSKTKTKLL